MSCFVALQSVLLGKCKMLLYYMSHRQVPPPAAGHLSVRGGSTAPATSGPSEQAHFETDTHTVPATHGDAESFTSITNITSSKYSITTNEDFNINIAINSNNEGSTLTSSTAQRSISTSCLSKSSCHISSVSPEPNITKTFGGSLGSFTSKGARLTRTRVSIPPSARNRDRSARPESFRLSSDMASHTRVLLKARSFAGDTHKHRNGRHYARTSLRDDHLGHSKDQYTAVSQVEYQQNNFTATCSVPSGTVSHATSLCGKYKTAASEEEKAAGTDFHHVETNSVEETSIVIINKLTRQERIYDESSWEESWEATTPTNEELKDTFSSQWTEPTRKDSSLSFPSAVVENKLPPKYKTSVLITDSGSERDSIDSSRAQMMRARSFTGLVTPRGLTSASPSPTRERLDGATGSAFLKIPVKENCDRLLHVTGGTRRARLSREGKSLRFSSDLGYGARPKSKKEVFV